MIEVDVHVVQKTGSLWNLLFHECTLTSKMLCQPVRESGTWPGLTRLSTKAHWDLPFHPGPWRKVPKRSEIDVDVHRYYAERSAIWGDFAGCHTSSWKPLKQWTMPTPYRVITCWHVSVSVSKWRSFAQTCSAVKATWTIVCLAILQSYQRFA